MLFLYISVSIYPYIYIYKFSYISVFIYVSCETSYQTDKNHLFKQGILPFLSGFSGFFGVISYFLSYSASELLIKSTTYSENQITINYYMNFATLNMGIDMV